ncbi:uncharacterized protein LOC116212896 [Punica granatum]|uniref:Uncharacterized protein LOC116212896 n=2 Tax=Punica granatum TaxID=22663 RepID=A0A6P8EAC7_PUNGR|nr:uncharacterized protein LOC116212896 [Punica granatum]PKI35747.1 hypothetical protein CRG98_043905 [Punica granatum]
MMRNNDRAIIRSRTFHDQAPPPSASTTAYPPSVPKSQPTPVPNLVEFPTSPQRKVGEDMLHFGHPQHPLAHIYQPDLFTCSGCKEHGAGKRFSCQHCDYQLHEFCAVAPQALEGHPLHVQHQLLFYSKPVKGGMTKSKCEACGKSIKGYAFRCVPCNFQLHPCCAMLPQEIIFSAHPHTLRLLPAPASSSSTTTGADPSSLCGECRRRRPGRLYRCTACGCDYCLHAVCAKVIFNGLYDTGIKDPEKKQPSVLAAAASLASKVVAGLFTGIAEGVGEGVGDLIVQNIITGSTLVVPKKIEYS